MISLEMQARFLSQRIAHVSSRSRNCDKVKKTGTNEKGQVTRTLQRANINNGTMFETEALAHTHTHSHVDSERHPEKSYVAL